MEREVISWQAPEFEHHEKEVLWSWGSIIIATAVLISALLAKNFLFAVFVVIAEILVLIWGNRKPRKIKFAIDDKNIIIEDRERHALKELDHFGFIEFNEDDPYIELGLAFNRLRPMMRILMPRNLVKPVEQKLKLFGRKMELEPTFSDTIERLLKF